MNREFTTKICAYLYYKHESNYNKIPYFVEINPKTTNKTCRASKQNLWFSNHKYP